MQERTGRLRGFQESTGLSLTSAGDLNRTMPALIVLCAPHEGKWPAWYEHHGQHDLAILEAEEGSSPGYCPNRDILESERTAMDVWARTNVKQESDRCMVNSWESLPLPSA